MRLLGVNVDHVATVRQARNGAVPDPVRAALVCERSGADSIVAHLREDRRHIQDADIFKLKSALKIPLNMEMAIHPSVMATALQARPHTATLVPERRRERTTESGLDAIRDRRRLALATDRLRSKGIEVSYFMDADLKQIKAAIACGAQAVEIHTGPYASARTAAVRRREVSRIIRAVRYANGLGVRAHVGHGLDYKNTPLIAAISGIEEFNIGFSIISESLFCGLSESVGRMKRLIRKPSSRR